MAEMSKDELTVQINTVFSDLVAKLHTQLSTLLKNGYSSESAIYKKLSEYAKAFGSFDSSKLMTEPNPPTNNSIQPIQNTGIATESVLMDEMEESGDIVLPEKPTPEQIKMAQDMAKKQNSDIKLSESVYKERLANFLKL